MTIYLTTKMSIEMIRKIIEDPTIPVSVTPMQETIETEDNMSKDKTDLPTQAPSFQTNSTTDHPILEAEIIEILIKYIQFH